MEKRDPLFLIFPTHSHFRSLCVLLEMNVSYAGQLLETVTNLELGIIRPIAVNSNDGMVQSKLRNKSMQTAKPNQRHARGKVKPSPNAGKGS